VEKRIKISIIILLWEELFLTKAERDFLIQSEGIDRNKQRYIRYKLRRKIKHFYHNELPLLVKKGYIADDAAANSYSVAVCGHNDSKSDNKKGAGSGNFVLPSQITMREGNISNPHVLSGMGLAIQILNYTLKFRKRGT
jgi:hypothetical protein